MVQIRWNWKGEEMVGLSFDVYQNPDHKFLMNSIIWNCRGASKPSFQKHVRELVLSHNPAILVVMETQVGGNRAREITKRLPFDGAINSDVVGYVGGIWVLWNSNKVVIWPALNKKFTSQLRYEFLM